MYRINLAWLFLLVWLTVGLTNNAYSRAFETSSENDFGGSSAPDSTIQHKRVYTTLRISKTPKIDGKLDDNCWTLGEWQSDYLQFTPVYKAKASLPTQLKVLYDDKNVYVGIRAIDHRDNVTRRLGRRDNFDGDVVGVHFDSYHDRRTAFEFDVTSAGQQIDVWVGNDGWDTNWNAVWYARVAYEDSAWTAEFQIPLSQLRYGKSDEQIWGFNAWRTINRLQEENHWNLVANDGTGLVYTFGELHGIKNLPQSRRMEFLPYLSGKMTTNGSKSSNPYTRGTNYDGFAGVDAKIGLSNNFTLDATINPDFGQVEADPSVMNLTAFETYFEEKRPFFVEGKNIFDFSFDGDKLFYTRRIGHAPSYSPAYDAVSAPEFTTIGGAAKISGKTTNGLSLGVINALTLKEKADYSVDGNESTVAVEPLTNYFIGRVEKDFDKGNTLLGAVLTHTHRIINDSQLDFLSNDALTYGVDFTKYWNDRKYFIELKTIGSHIAGEAEAIERLQTSSARYFQRPDIEKINFDPDKTSLNGFGASFKAGKWSKGHWRYNEEISLRSPGLELNDLGFMPLANLLKNTINLSYVETENQWILKKYSVGVARQNAWNMQGGHLYSQNSLSFQSELRNSWSMYLAADHKYQITDEKLLRGGLAMKVPAAINTTLSLYSNSSKKLRLGFAGQYNKQLTGSSRYFNLAPEISYRPLPNLNLSLEAAYGRNLNELQYVTRYEKTDSSPAWLLGTIDNKNMSFTFRIDLALTPELTIQYYGSPFGSVADYTDFKKVTNPTDKIYENRFTLVPYLKTENTVQLDTDSDGTTDLSLGSPDFSYQQFRSNLVLRWEYRRGSALYLVWAQNRTAFNTITGSSLADGFAVLSDLVSQNIVMVKLNFWLSN